MFKDLLFFELTLTFSSKMTAEFLQIDAISALMCKYYKSEIPSGSDRIDILFIAWNIAYAICRNNPKAATAVRYAIITLQIGLLTTLTPSTLCNSSIIRVWKRVNIRRKIFRRLDLNFP